MTLSHLWWPDWGLGGFEWLFALVPLGVTIAFWALIILLVARLVKSRPGPRVGGATPALELLEERYARGEITREEFLERKTVLSGQPPA